MLNVGARRSKLICRFGGSTLGVAAVEFALVFPFLILIMGAFVEIFRYVQVSREITSYASAAATMLATNTTGTIAYTDLHYAADAAMIMAPQILADSFSKGVSWSQDISISMAGISFTPTVTGCTSGCTYKANVNWTGSQEARACGSTLTAVADSSAPTASSLPTDLFNAVTTPSGTSAPLFEVVVDVSYSWSPILFSKFFHTIAISRSAFFAPRYVTKVLYSAVAGDDGFGKECPGY